MDKRVVIHAGPGKTGTSAIQYWLREHHDALRKEGILYPKHRLDANRIGSGNIGSVCVRSPMGGWTLVEDKVRALRDRFERSACETLLLSSEYFFELLPQLHAAFEQPRFVVYLRDPIELVESAHVQVIKRHCGLRAFSPPDRVHFDVLVRLDELLRTTPDLDVVPRPYDRALFTGGSIVSDLLSVVRVDLPVGSDPRINTRYTFEALEFKRLANHYPLGQLDKELDRVLQRCEAGTADYSLTGPEARAALLPAVLEQIDTFIDRHGADHLTPFRDHLAEARVAPRPTLPVPDPALEAVATHLRIAAPSTYQQLAALVRDHPNQSVPSPWFRRHFGLAAADPAVQRAAFAELAARLRSDDLADDADLYRELARFCMHQGRPAAAELCYEAALSFRPEDAGLQDQLARARWSQAEGRSAQKPAWRRVLRRWREILGRG